MRRWIAVLVLAALTAACGTTRVDQNPTGSDTSSSVPVDDADRIEAACERVIEGLAERNTALILSSLEDLDAILSTVGAEDLREHAHSASDALPAFSDTPPSDDDLADAAPNLIELSNGLIALGAETNCAGVGEVAANFDARVAERDVAESLAAAREKWSAAGLSTYSLELSPGPLPSFDGGCGAGGSLLIQVVDGRVEKAIDQISGCRVEIADADGVPLTVEELFALVEGHLDAETLEVDFEPELGYPRSIFIRDDSGITEMSVTDLTPGEAEGRDAEAILAELAKQRALWAINGSNTYTMVVEIGCFCPEEHRGPFEVTVVDGDIETVTMNDEVVEPADRSFLTVEGLFSTIEDYAHSDKITVTYAPAGYPSTIDVDPDFNTVDEELFIDVHELIPSGG